MAVRKAVCLSAIYKLGKNKMEETKKRLGFEMLNGCFLALGSHQFVVTYGVEFYEEKKHKHAHFYVWNEYTKKKETYETEKEAEAAYKNARKEFIEKGSCIISEGV